MPILRCKMCGGTMEIDAKQSVAVCQYCGTRQTLPRLDSERVAGLYERADLLRRGNDFDKAAAVYEQIVSLAPNDAEAYWSLGLCRYGIEYVEDPASHRRVPTINRVRFGSILEDADYLSALRNADDEQKSVYIAEAEAIVFHRRGQRCVPFSTSAVLTHQCMQAVRRFFCPDAVLGVLRRGEGERCHGVKQTHQMLHFVAGRQAGNINLHVVHSLK